MKKQKKALEKANDAQEKIKFFKKKEAIEKLQAAVLAESEAMAEIAECNTCIFENEKAMAEITKRLLFLGVGNAERNQIVVKKISDYLKGIDHENSNNMMKCELSGLITDLNSQLDLMQRMQNISQGIVEIDDEITKIRNNQNRIEQELEQRNTEIKETRKIANKAMEQVNNSSKKRKFEFWIICGIIIIAIITLSLLLGIR